MLKYNRFHAEVAEWQTHGTQNPARATSCGFDSHLRHHEKKLHLASVLLQAPKRSFDACFFSICDKSQPILALFSCKKNDKY